MKLLFPTTPRTWCVRPKLAAGELPAADARGITLDAKRLRGKFLAEVSYIRKSHNSKPATGATNRVKRRPKLGTHSPKPETKTHPAFIDDGD